MAAAVRSSPLPVLLVRVSDRTIMQVSDSVTTLLGGSREQLLAHDLGEVIDDPVDGPSSLALLAAGEIDGYRRSHRAYQRLDGTLLAADVWLTGYTDPPRPFAIAIILPKDQDAVGSRPLIRPSANDPRLAVGTVDGDWLVDRVSAEVERLLGFAAETVVGQPVLAGVHPRDIRGFLTTVDHATEGRGTASTTLRLRRSSSSWRSCRVVISQLTGEDPLAFGFAIAPAARTAASAAAEATRLEDQLRTVGRGAGVVDLTVSLTAMPSALHLPALARLSARELEVAARLFAGYRVRQIARSLFLSESTVRNHLTGVFRELGVGSQEELLALLRSAIGSTSGGFGHPAARL